MASNGTLIQAIEACVNQARALLECARAAQGCGHPHIAYHLAVLALEELGRRVLIIQEAAYQPNPPALLKKKMQDHVWKLFWCLFDRNFFENKPTATDLKSMRTLAEKLHEKRLEGLYVEQNAGGLKIPSNAIRAEECEQILKLAEDRLVMVMVEKVRENSTDEERTLHTWFIQNASNSERWKFIFSDDSMSKLSELKNGQAWVCWLKSEFDKQQAESMRFIQMELERSRNLDGTSKKKKWKVRIRLYSDSHTIQQRELHQWNNRVDWIKLRAVPEKQNQLIVEFIFLDRVPLDSLCSFAYQIARRFVVALNIGSKGFWWWLPEQVDSYYENIEDLEAKRTITFQRTPSLKVNWGKRRVLTASDLTNIWYCPNWMKSKSTFPSIIISVA